MRQQLPASAKEARRSRWSTASVLKDVTVRACPESWWEFGLADASSSGVVVRKRSVHGVEAKTTSSRQDQTWVIHQSSRGPSGCSWVVRPFPRTLIRLEGRTGGCSRGEGGLFTFRNHRWLFRAARDLLIPHCVNGGLSAHPHTTFLSYNKQNTKHMSESHMFILHWHLPHLSDWPRPSPGGVLGREVRSLLGHLGHSCAFAETCTTMGQSGPVLYPVHLYLIFSSYRRLFHAVLSSGGPRVTIYSTLPPVLLVKPSWTHGVSLLWPDQLAGYRPCGSRGTWSSLAQGQPLASRTFLCSHLNFWHTLAACEWGVTANSGWYFSLSHLRVKSLFPVYTFRELSPAISLLWVLERSTFHVLSSTLKTSESTSAQSDTDGSACSCLSGAGDPGQTHCCVRRWISTSVVSPCQATVHPKSRQQACGHLHVS